MLEVTTEQRSNFLKYFDDYLVWVETAEGKSNLLEHREHQKFFQERMSKKAIEGMSTSQFKVIYKGLWASSIWGNKDWYVENKLLKPNKDLEYIKGHLLKLFYDENTSLAKRYSEFKKNIKGLGSSALTELLHFVFPDKYCLWNDKPKTVLPFLGLDSLLPENVFKYQIRDGEEYSICNNVMELLRDELRKAGLKSADFIDLDCYIWFIFIKKLPKRKRGRPEEEDRRHEKETVKKGSISINNHEEAEYYLLKLGGLLGYITYTCDKKSKAQGIELGEVAIAKELPPFAGARDMNSARTVDIIWLDDDENPKYCFEVEHTMDILRSLNRLYQLKQFHISFFIVSPEDKRSKFEVELSKSPFRNEKDRFHFISYNELISLIESSQTFFTLKNRLFAE